MAIVLAQNWWILALRGVAAIIFSILAFAFPNQTIITLALFFGAYAMVDGIFAIISAIKAPEGYKHWRSLLLEGIIGVVIGAITFFLPYATALAVVIFIAVWATATGILEIVAAIRLRREITNEWVLILTGALSLLFGIVLVAMPDVGAVALVWVIGTYAFVFGVMMLVLALRLRSWNNIASVQV